MTVRRRSDFTGDHSSDILFDDRSSGNFVEWQMQGFTIQAVQVLNSGTIPTTFGVMDGLADFNGDGKSDLLWRDPSNGQIAFWTMYGTQIQGISGITVSKNFDVVGAHGDYNADGKTDVLLRDWTNGNMSEFLMNGNAIASVQSLPYVTTDFGVVNANVDFNNDGHNDVLFRQYAGGQFKMWLMLGNGTPVESVFATGLDANWFVHDAVGDYNADGSSDILVRNASTGQFVTWQMLGGNIQAGTSYGNIPVSLQVLDGHGDYNGDGTSDILWRDMNTGQFVVWTMVNGQLFNSSVINNIPLSNVLIDGHDDFNGDGKSDLLFRDSANGNVTEVQMNGPNVVGAQVLASVPTFISIANGAEGLTVDVNHNNTYFGTVENDLFEIQPGGTPSTVTGGGGSDQFVFHTVSGMADITDFQSNVDRIVLDHTVFTGLAPGVLQTDNFSVNALVDPPHSGTGISFNPQNHTLVYFMNGVLVSVFAELDHSSVVSNDILVI